MSTFTWTDTDKPEVNPDSVAYLGRHYYRAGERVYYRNTLLGRRRGRQKSASATAITPTTVPVCTIKGHWIAGADVSSLSEVAVTERTSADFHYLKDANRVLLPGKGGAGGRTGGLHRESGSRATPGVTHYGYDGRRYFFKGPAITRSSGGHRPDPAGPVRCNCCRRTKNSAGMCCFMKAIPFISINPLPMN